jgi:hypothetical protein
MQGGWGLGHDAAQVGIRASTSQEHHIHMVKRVNPGQIRRSVPLLSESHCRQRRHLLLSATLPASSRFDEHCHDTESLALSVPAPPSSPA